MKLRVVIISGEASGDLLASFIIRALKEYFPNIEFQGIGGPLTAQEAGLSFKSWANFEDLGVMGFFLAKLWFFYRLIVKTARRIRAMKPDLLLTIDSPELCLRISKRVGKGCLRVHCVPPAVWAWRPGRARKMHHHTDHLLCLFPFEASFFPQMSCFFVGHPALQSPLGQPERFWKQHPYLRPEHPLVCLLPGSRRSEITTLLPIFQKTLRLVQSNNKNVQGMVISLTSAPFDWPQDIPWLVCDRAEQADAFAASSVALAASGTVGLQLLRQKTPMVVAYRLSSAMAWIAKKLLKTKFVSLVNILAQKQIVPECLQEACTAENLAEKLTGLLCDHMQEAQKQKEALSQLLQDLSTSQSFHDNIGHAFQEILKRRN